MEFVVETQSGAIDEQVLERAYAEDRILLTEDKDFGELVFRLRKPARGVVLLRFAVADRFAKIPRLRNLLEENAERLPGRFAVLTVEKVRFRPMLRAV